MKITFQSPPKNLDEKMVYNILRDYKMLNCEVLVRDDEGIFDTHPGKNAAYPILTTLILQPPSTT